MQRPFREELAREFRFSMALSSTRNLGAEKAAVLPPYPIRCVPNCKAYRRAALAYSPCLPPPVHPSSKRISDDESSEVAQNKVFVTRGTQNSSSRTEEGNLDGSNGESSANATLQRAEREGPTLGHDVGTASKSYDGIGHPNYESTMTESTRYLRNSEETKQGKHSKMAREPSLRAQKGYERKHQGRF
ncbi:unnamed protein product [Protopolystoma xenopodis]|uniref:Uncharacterized protein n=1 Tax=Protopolystoma xenopodis TaxID=117903 RepID=A0A448X3Z2_9PLAT|nr:unnamed protein product [Protopolystoma xenopodis]